MGEVAALFNFTKKQVIWNHLPFCKPNEWITNPAAGVLVNWYMLQNRDDDIRFYGDFQDDAKFSELLDEFEDITDRVVEELVRLGFLESNGRQWEEDDDPDCYVIDLRVSDRDREWYR